jgi:hypothetical protein
MDTASPAPSHSDFLSTGTRVTTDPGAPAIGVAALLRRLGTHRRPPGAAR